MAQGWVKTHREITVKPIYQQSPLYLRIFERLIIEANSRCARIPYGKETKLIRRGERLTSIGQIAEWVGWYERGIFKFPNKKTVSDVLDWLIKNELIEIYNKGNARETHYNVLNYCIYQAKDSDESNAKVTPDKRPLDTNKKLKNVKKLKKENIYTSEFEKFFNIYPNQFNKEQTFKNWNKLLKLTTIESIMKALNNYIQSIEDNETESKFIYRSTNFIGEKAYYKGFIDYIKPKEKPKVTQFKPQQQGNFQQRQYDDSYFNSLYVDTGKKERNL